MGTNQDSTKRHCLLQIQKYLDKQQGEVEDDSNEEIDADEEDYDEKPAAASKKG